MTSSQISLVFVFLLTVGCCYAEPQFPFPQHANYATGTIFPNRLSREEMDADVRGAYGRWKNQYLAQAGTEADGQKRYRVKLGTAEDSKTVSEGQGYGMMIVAYVAGADSEAREIFDGLWEFFNDHRSVGDSRLMDWSVPHDESADATGNRSAFDGDCDIAFGLLLAERQWGNGGRIHYTEEAREVIAGILESEIGPSSRLPMLGDWVDAKGSTYNEYTVRPSDFMPDHFRAFQRLTGLKAWGEVAKATGEAIDSIQANFSGNPATGLMPDFIVPFSPTDLRPKPAGPSFLEGPFDGSYYYNSGRVPFRIATDALLNADPVSRVQAGKISLWAEQAAGGVPEDFRSGYALDGTPLENSDYFTQFFVAPLGVAAMTQSSQQQWLNGVYDAVRNHTEGYFEDSVALLCLLVMTGNYWDPTLVSASGETSTESAWVLY